MTGETVAARVAAGAAWLDENRPGWEGSIDLETLDMQNSCRCILGQLDGDFYDALARMCFSEKVRGAWSVAHGFEPGWDDPWSALDEAWISLVKVKERHLSDPAQLDISKVIGGQS